jgi:hypothetical protein
LITESVMAELTDLSLSGENLMSTRSFLSLPGTCLAAAFSVSDRTQLSMRSGTDVKIWKNILAKRRFDHSFKFRFSSNLGMVPPWYHAFGYYLTPTAGYQAGSILLSFALFGATQVCYNTDIDIQANQTICLNSSVSMRL